MTATDPNGKPPPNDPIIIPIKHADSPDIGVGGTQTFHVTVTLQNSISVASHIPMDVSDRIVLNPPSGSWPYSVPVPANTTSVTVAITSNSVTAAKLVTIYTKPTGGDTTVCDETRIASRVTVTP